ncbi:50S ribosomal protein L7/L12, partial [Photobacterium damselae]
MSITNEQILDAVAEMSVMQVVELIEAMEEKFGVTAAAAVVAGGAAAEAAEEQTEFDVILTAAGANKV